MLPTHRDAGSTQQGWRDMALAGSEESKCFPRFVFGLRWRLRHARTTVLLGGAVAFCLWWLFYSIAPSPHDYLPFPHRPPYPPPPPHFEGPSESTPRIDWNERAQNVKQAFVHAYRGYEMYAMPRDELLPLSNGSINNFNGWGVTMVDSLDTMFIMGLHDEFERGIAVVKNMTFTGSNYTYAPFFETTIRYLGGLLSAYAFSGDVDLLKRADELGMALLPAFGTESGLPSYSVNPKTGSRMGGWSGASNGWLAEVASCQMEYKYLAKVTGRKEYYDAANKVTKTLYNANTTRLPSGLLPTLWNLTSGQPSNTQISIGALADSAYEYFLKQWLLTGQTEKESLELYLRSMTGILTHNVFLSPQRSLLYVTDISGTYPTHKFEHLSCFFPGLLALGAHTLPSDVISERDREWHRWAALGIAQSCAAVYADQVTGLGAEEVMIVTNWELEMVRLRKEQQAQREREAFELAAEQERERQRLEEEGVDADNDNDTPDPVGNDLEYDANRGKLSGGSRGSGGKGKGKPLVPPHGMGPVYKQVEVTVNQTEANEKLRWVNALAVWRDGGAKGTPPGLQPLGKPMPADNPIRDYHTHNTGYLLRPETIESFFIMWRTTHDVVWRERGWAAFEALEREARTPSGYASLKNVGFSGGQLSDSMPSYFLAETLKYLYLLFSDDSVIPLDRYVFNTEAHPLPVFQWNEWEKTKFGIS